MPSNAVRLSDFGSGIGTFGAVLQVDNTNQRIGIGTTNPQSTLQVGVAITMDGAAGVITATTFDGALSGNATSATSATSATTATNAEGLTGTPDITVRNITGVAATFTGVVNYEDVTNVDSVGVVTARAGLDVVGGGVSVTAGGINVNAGGANVIGVSTFTSDTTFADGKVLAVTSSGAGLIRIKNSSSTDTIQLQGGNGSITQVVNVNSSGIITATEFHGDASNLTNLPASGDSNDITASLFI